MMGGIGRRGDADPHVQRLPAIRMWAKAGVMEDDYYSDLRSDWSI